MWVDITFNGDPLEVPSDEDGTVNVGFAGEDERTAYRCDRCDERFADENDTDEECMYAECATHTGDENCDDHDCSFPHELVQDEEAFSWVNSASISFDEEKNQIDLAVSLGDPRGAFLMRLYKADDGTVRMEVPYPGQPLAHMPLTPVSEGSQGFYIVNGEGQ